MESVGTQGVFVEGLTKFIRRRRIIHDVSLRLGRGEVVGILGRNGAGKTSCFYSIAGLLIPDSGTVLIDGIDMTFLPMYRRARLGLGYLPQETSVFRGMTVRNNILSALEFSEPDRKRRLNKLNSLLDEFAISHLSGVKANSLSGGETRRVEIARCLASNPNYVLLDEPFAGIDPVVGRDIRNLILQLRDRGIGVLITDHNWRETLSLVERVYVLSEGKILVSGTPGEVRSDEHFVRDYLGHDDGEL
ncbi:MAG: LPS export ABC transporter ATP-binding protein [Rhodobacteraceae bacterium]|nr:LPS export ABC transporter ATP-binding protein [Paracoccaceae bacterium]